MPQREGRREVNLDGREGSGRTSYRSWSRDDRVEEGVGKGCGQLHDRSELAHRALQVLLATAATLRA